MRQSLSPGSNESPSDRAVPMKVEEDRMLAPTAPAADVQVGDQEEQGQEERIAQAAHGGEDGEHTEEVEDGEGGDAQQPRAAPDPGRPTAAMVAEHNLTHIPYRSWCECCVRGKAKRRPSRRLCGTYSESSNARVRMDYAYLTEQVESGDEAEVGQQGYSTSKADSSLTMLVMQESQCRSVWAYAV